jgi:cellobiose transport system permease protein
MNSRILPKVIPSLFVGLLTVVSLYPFYVMVVMGTYRSEDLFMGLKLLPGDYLLGNLRTVFSRNFAQFYWNSFYIATASTIGGCVTSSMAGFAFAKFDFRFKKGLFYFVLGSLMIPLQLGLVGFVIEIKWFHMINTHLPLILLPMASAVGVFWMTQYVKSAIPSELIESAEIDGCPDFGIYAWIVVPNIKAALLTLFLLFFLWSWDTYLLPLIILNKAELYTVPLGISSLGSMYRTDYGARILALSIATLPIVIIFTFGSRYLVQGLMVGSVKG